MDPETARSENLTAEAIQHTITAKPVVMVSFTKIPNRKRHHFRLAFVAKKHRPMIGKSCLGTDRLKLPWPRLQSSNAIELDRKAHVWYTTSSPIMREHLGLDVQQNAARATIKTNRRTSRASTRTCRVGCAGFAHIRKGLSRRHQ